MNGQVVKGVQFVNLKVEGDPAELAADYEDQGADEVVFLDITASHENRDTTLEVVKRTADMISIPFTVGCGIRNITDIQNALSSGADKVSVNTAAVNNPSLVKEAVARFGSEHVAVAIDEKDGKVAVHGWKNKSAMDCLELAGLFDSMGVGALIFTPISVDGTLEGPRIQKTVELMNSVTVPVVASGGVAQLSDLIALNETGVWGVIVGTAIYEKKFTVKQALEALKGC